MPNPAFTFLSLGAGVQSTSLLLLAAEGRLGHLDGAIFADTQSEPAKVYRHLDRLEAEVARPAGIPIYRVTEGCLTDDALDPDHHFASMPLYVRNDDGGDGMMRRQCTSEYKLKPIKNEVRRHLGYPYPRKIPTGLYAQMWIGFSTDEITRVKDSMVQYMRNVFPLIDLDWSRIDCMKYLKSMGFGDTPKSACWACPYHGNRGWRNMRDHEPEDWAKAVAFDAAIRTGGAHATSQGEILRGRAYLHRSRIPLGQAPIEHITRGEAKLAAAELEIAEEGEPDGCSPWSCRSGEPVA